MVRLQRFHLYTRIMSNFLEICKEIFEKRELSNKIQANLLTFFDGMDQETLDQMCEIIDETIKNS